MNTAENHSTKAPDIHGKRLEQRMRVKPGRRLIYLMPNLELDEPEETPYLIKLSSDVWVNVFGPPLTGEEIQALRDELGVRER